MQQDEFTPGELKLIFQRFDEKLDSIKDQTTKTNGRVLSNEIKIQGLKDEHTRWKAYWVAGTTIISTTIGIIISVFR